MNSSSNSVNIDGNKIRLLREQKGLTQLYLATVVGVTTDTISRWENRRYPSVKMENARKLAEALEVPLEELLQDPGDCSPTPEHDPPAREDGPTTSGTSAGFRVLFARHRRMIAIGAGCLLLAALLAFTLTMVNRSDINAVRIMPTHTAPMLAFPVIIQMTGPIEADNTLLIREELRGDGEAVGASGEGTPKQFGKNPRWIGKLTNGQAAFFYLVEPGKKLRTGEEIRFGGDLIAREGQSSGEAIDGPARIVIAPYHWADLDQDYVISDTEIRKAHATYAGVGGQLIDFNGLEELWMAGGYAWNKKTQTFTPSPAASGKE